jgi:2,6-dihydroxypseudooxynicotine hydrolase
MEDKLMNVGLEISEGRDEMVNIALRNWAPRFVANGVDYGDLVRTVARIRTWDDWLEEWSVTAREFEELARQAEERGSKLSASEAWRRAAMCWHWGKFLFMEDPAKSAVAQQRMAECYDRGLWSLEPPGERVGVPYNGVAMAGILRRPVGSRRPPVVVMLPGLDSTKEELQTTADYFLRRGLVTLTVDGPGQGETESRLKIEAASEKCVGAIIDFVQTLPALDASRVGVYGVSLGGYYAVRAAAFESRIVATVENAGPFCLGQLHDGLPPMTRAAIKHRTGAADMEDARKRALELDLTGVAERVTEPLLVVHGTDDRLVPFVDAERIAKAAPNAVLARFEHGNHGMTNQVFQMRSLVADWMATQLEG